MIKATGDRPFFSVPNGHWRWLYVIRVGIVGCGGISQAHAWALSNMPGVEIVATADILVERANMLSEKYTEGKANVYSSFEEMIEKESRFDSKLDVIHICTPHNLHVPMAIDGLKNGISVFCEKPPAISRAQFEEMKSVSDKSKAKIGFCFQNRYNQTVLKTDDIIKSHKLGKVIGGRGIVTWRRDEGYYLTDWKGKLKTEGGGALINQSIHTLDLMLQFLGQPTRVEASVQNHHLKDQIEVEDTIEAWMEFDDGKRGCFYASNGYAADAPVILEITCEKGSVTLLDQMLLLKDENGYSQIPCPEPAGIGKSCWGSGHAKCISDFYEKIVTGERFRNDLSGVENIMNTVLKIYEAGGHANGDGK